MRRGFYIADGAGVGKRQVAAIIYDNWLQKRRKHLWISASSDVKLEAEEDFRELGMLSNGEVRGLKDSRQRTSRITVVVKH